ncbi:MAG: hypothetical protein ACR2O0_00250 [Rhizobiaceae bacterium]
MPLRQIIFAIVFGVAIAVIMQVLLGGNLLIHMIVAVPAALAGGYYASRNQTDVKK